MALPRNGLPGRIRQLELKARLKAKFARPVAQGETFTLHQADDRRLDGKSYVCIGMYMQRTHPRKEGLFDMIRFVDPETGQRLIEDSAKAILRDHRPRLP